MMKELEIVQREMTIGGLVELIESNTLPVQKTGHVGNQNPNAMTVTFGLPNGVDNILVNTVQGNDRNSTPYQVNGEPLVSKRQAAGRAVDSIEVKRSDDKNGINPPERYVGRKLTDIHGEQIDLHGPNNPTRLMTDVFSDHPEVFLVVIESCKEMGSLTRYVEPGGKISTGNEPQENIYGFKGSKDGLLIPLPGMMAMGVMLGKKAGSDTTVHLAGPDMVRYTQEEDVMGQVEECLNRTYALLGIVGTKSTIIVVDTTNLGVIHSYKSQHDQRFTGKIEIYDHLTEPCGR